MADPLISVVTPSFNQGHFLEDAIESVKRQDYDAVEHIVIDGGSTDDSVAVLTRREKDLAYWVSEPDAGHADAVNKGWAVASGEILAFLNADDFYFPGALRRVADAFVQHPYAALVHGQGIWVDSGGAPLMVTSVHLDAGDFWRTLPGIPQPAAFIRSDAVRAVGGLDSSFNFALDGEFFARIAGRYPVISLPDVLAALRMHPGAKSTAEGWRFSSEIIRLGAKIAAHPDCYPNFKASAEEMLAAALRVSARFAYMNGRPVEGLRKIAAGAALGGSDVLAPSLLELLRLAGFCALGRARYARVAAHLGRLRGS